jgi:DNA-binding NarL/FixJ family response regulator
VLPVGADAVEARLGAGDVEGAAALLERLRRNGGTGAALARAAALVHAERGEPDQAARRLEAELADAMPSSGFATGRLQLALGQVQRRARRKAAARAALSAARASFRECGAALWEERAAAEIARIGGRPPATSALTPTERRVAELVARGDSNKAVAAALFVTVGTVEAHLSRVYAKLGVRSRAELAHRAHDPEGWGRGGQSVGVSGISSPSSEP